MSKDYEITILTTRRADLVEHWLEKYDLQKYIKRVTNQKIPAVMYVDDRAVQFNGNYEEVYSEITNFVHYAKRR